MNNEELKENCRHRLKQIGGFIKQREFTNDKGQLTCRFTDEETELIFKEIWRIKIQWNFANNLPPPDFSWMGFDSVKAK
jgi:hypothetical protein